MIIFGTRGINSNHQRGDFYCPGCDTSRQYIWHRVNNWFTLYFIPVIPLGMAGEYVECQLCLKTYETNVLQLGEQLEKDRQQFLAEFQKGIRDIMILIMLADGIIEPEEVAVIQGIYSNLAGEDYDSDQLNQDIERIQAQIPQIEENSNQAVKEYAGKLNGLLNEEGKVMIFHAALSVAQSDGRIPEEEQLLLDTIVKSLNLSQSVVEAITEKVNEDQQSA